MPRTPTRTVTLATCRRLPALTESDEVLAGALRAHGAVVRTEPWDAIAPGGGVVCLRSTWDYHTRAAEFRRWIGGFSDRAGALWNPAATVLWNMDKIYLRELAARGVPVPRTHWVEPAAAADPATLLAGLRWERGVLKPRVSASAHGTHIVVTTTAPGDGGDYRDGALLQEFVPEIRTRGEFSLIFIDGACSHAVLKRVAAGDFRVQRDFGGTFTRVEPAPPLVDFCAEVLRVAAMPWIYARVDGVETAAGPVLMELELIEPDLFFHLAPEGAEGLAECLAPGS